jgi:subtilase family serine protease
MRHRPSALLAATILGGLSSIGFISPVAAARAPVQILPAKMALIRPKLLQTSHRYEAVNINRQWTFGLVLPSKNTSGLFAYANAVGNPNFSEYHQFLTHSQLMARFGPSISVMSLLTTYLKQQGLSVSKDGQMIKVTGLVGQINRMFKTTLTSYQHGGQQFIAPSSEITISSPLRIAEGVTGLVTNTLVPLNVGKPAKQVPLMKQATLP